MLKISMFWSLPFGVILIIALLVGVSFSRDLAIIPALLLGLLLVTLLLALCLRHIQLGVFVFIFSLPFERIPSVHVGGATVRFSQVMLLVLVLALCLRALKSRRITFGTSPYFPIYLLFLVTLLLSFTAMHAYSRGATVLAFMVFTSLAMWVIPACINSKTTLEHSIRALFFVTIGISIFGLYQYFGDLAGLSSALTGLRELYTKAVFGFPRVQSTELEPLYLANFLLIPLSLAATFAIRQSTRFSGAILSAVLSLGGLVLILTLSRGGYLGLAASLLVIGITNAFWLLKPRVLMLGFITTVVLALALVGIVSFTALGQKSIDETVKHFTQIGQDASALQRVRTYDQALRAFDQAPFTGVGIGNFGPFVADYPTILPPDGWAIVNNAPLEILAETGVIGLFVALVFLIVLYARSVKAFFIARDPALRASMLGLTAALSGVLVQYQFFSTFYIMHIWVLCGLIIATQNIILKDHATRTVEYVTRNS